MYVSTWWLPYVQLYGVGVFIGDVIQKLNHIGVDYVAMPSTEARRTSTGPCKSHCVRIIEIEQTGRVLTARLPKRVVRKVGER